MTDLESAHEVLRRLVDAYERFDRAEKAIVQLPGAPRILVTRALQDLGTGVAAARLLLSTRAREA